MMKNITSTTFIQEYNCKLGNGSGTGNLAKRFQENNQNYTGLDYSKSMIAIAEERGFVILSLATCGFSSRTKVDSIIITGRSTSYHF
jgi:predicted TPR repeat methyltransferase